MSMSNDSVADSLEASLKMIDRFTRCIEPDEAAKPLDAIKDSIDAIESTIGDAVGEIIELRERVAALEGIVKAIQDGVATQEETP